MARIVDVFPFFNELEILDIRLNELDPVVDEFILVEGTRTHQNKPKPLFFSENKQQFERFLPKINHLVIEHWPGFFHKFRRPRPFDLDNYQKEFAIRTLRKMPKDTNVIFSDLDEIPKAEEVARFRDTDSIKIFEQRFYNFWLNNLCTYFDTGGQDLPAQKNIDGIAYWRGSVMVPLGRIKTLKKTRLYRDLQSGPIDVIRDGGWHFSYIGDVQRIKTKLDAYAHPEYNKSIEEIEQIIRSGRSVIPGDATRFELQAIDETYPKYLLENQGKFSSLIGE